VFKVVYNRGYALGFFMSLFFIVNVTFFPIHFIGLQAGPRKYRSIMLKFKKLIRISTYGSHGGAVSMNLFLQLFYESLVRYRLVINHPIIISSPDWTVENRHHTFYQGVNIVLPPKLVVPMM
jgi:heme/copper-type cytochrome/quinol oxidase subunit 1